MPGAIFARSWCRVGPNDQLSVNVKIRANEIKVETGWRDYVFEPGYPLKRVGEVAAYIRNNGHLPDVPAAPRWLATGGNRAKLNKLLVQKIEELTLYMMKSSRLMA
ncbi:hypothetical protein GS399_05350 [Pedobacter sp. HMF7647]|uniref:Uncharacterized protein n=1 Tax=Hufsiella arboris TaxID=2695275 RepID=A0A7K1Y7M5_9SPHI|nr:hypothetical protein [Hufsiella arboris]MXV50391.1 hypothetical protein [Hufsiella arboris]